MSHLRLFLRMHGLCSRHDILESGSRIRDREIRNRYICRQCPETGYDDQKSVFPSAPPSAPPLSISTHLPPSRTTVANTNTNPPDLMPPILAGILAIYGLVVAVVISSTLKEKVALHTSFMQLSAGLSVGLCCLSAGFCIGIVGDAGVRATGQQPRMFVGMMMMLIFAEVLAIYGLIVGLLLLTSAENGVTDCSRGY